MIRKLIIILFILFMSCSDKPLEKSFPDLGPIDFTYTTRDNGECKTEWKRYTIWIPGFMHDFFMAYLRQHDLPFEEVIVMLRESDYFKFEPIHRIQLDWGYYYWWWEGANCANKYLWGMQAEEK